MPLEAAIGPARVIPISDRESIKVEELAGHDIQPGERILFKTYNSEHCWDTDSFVEDFVYLSAPAARYLVERGVRLVGIDYLSVGGFQADGEETHQALLKAGIWIIEGLDLKQVRPGRVELVCLPLKIAGGDGAPARALVRQLGDDGGDRRRPASVSHQRRDDHEGHHRGRSGRWRVVCCASAPAGRKGRDPHGGARPVCFVRELRASLPHR